MLKVETYLWVKAVGEPEGNSTIYPWIFLSSPNRLFIQILAQDPQSFQIKHNNIVLNTASAMGYTDALIKPVPLYHSGLCNYAPFPQ